MVQAYVLINCVLGSEKTIIQSLAHLNNVKEVHGTLGLYDIVVKVEGNSKENLSKTITDQIRKTPNVNSTITLMRAEGEELFKASDKLVSSMLGQNLSQAYVVIHCDKGEEYNVLKNLSKINDIKEAAVVFGYYDVICKLETSDHSTLEKLITKHIRALPHVRTTMTLNVIIEQGSKN